MQMVGTVCCREAFSLGEDGQERAAHCHCCMLLMRARMLSFSWAESASSFCFWATPVPRPYSRPQYLASSILSSKNNCRTGQRSHGENDAKSHARNHATSPHHHISTSQLSEPWKSSQPEANSRKKGSKPFRAPFWTDVCFPWALLLPGSLCCWQRGGGCFCYLAQTPHLLLPSLYRAVQWLGAWAPHSAWLTVWP